MERKFRIIKELYYSHDKLDEQIIFYVQEWKKGFFGRWKWRYWTTWNYDMQTKRRFSTQHEAEQLIERFVKMKPYKKVVEEITF